MMDSSISFASTRCVTQNFASSCSHVNCGISSHTVTTSITTASVVAAGADRGPYTIPLLGGDTGVGSPPVFSRRPFRHLPVVKIFLFVRHRSRTDHAHLLAIRAVHAENAPARQRPAQAERPGLLREPTRIGK